MKKKNGDTDLYQWNDSSHRYEPTGSPQEREFLRKFVDAVIAEGEGHSLTWLDFRDGREDGKVRQSVSTYRNYVNKLLHGEAISEGGPAGHYRFQWKVTIPFDRFFGVSAERREGVIYLQADNLRDILAPRGSPGGGATPASLPGFTSTSRCYKARTWIDAWDALAGAYILDVFRQNHRQSPHLFFSGKEAGLEPQTPPASPGFVACLGLGFTHETDKMVGNFFEPWMRVSRWELGTDDSFPNIGDAACFDKRVFDCERAYARVKFIDPPKSFGGFRRMVPKDLDENEPATWVNRWAGRLDGPGVKDDYGIIARYNDASINQTDFLLAGWTECGTAAAGYFLAHEWETLWDKYGKDRGSRGNFLTVIAGDPGHIESWSEVDGLQVTSKKLQEAGIKCDW